MVVLARSWASAGPIVSSCSCRLSRAAPSPTTGISASSSHRRWASTVSDETAVDLTFPTKSNPTPFEIFHLSPTDQLTPALIKSRYLDLARIYHPDRQTSAKGKEKATNSDHEFKSILAAYEILQSPTKRAIYLRGQGGAGVDMSSSYAYNFRRGRPMSASYNRGPFPSAAWDWADPYNPHFRPSHHSARHRGTGWEAKGQFASNGTFFLAMMAATLFLTPISVWTAVPSGYGGYDGTATFVKEDGTIMRNVPLRGGAWNRHEDAAKALTKARREARQGGLEQREAIRRRVRQMENAKAYERASELQRIERQELGTGHLALPAPSPATRPSPTLPPPSP